VLGVSDSATLGSRRHDDAIEPGGNVSPIPSPLDRRTFVRDLAAAGGAVLAGTALGSCDNVLSPNRHVLPVEPDRAVGTVTRIPLRIPQPVTPSGITLTAAPGSASILTGKNTNAWMYNGGLPGPTLVARRGDRVDISYKNQLSEPSITHWHGMLVDHPNDGHPREVVGTGESYSYAFDIAQRAALNWYHPHPHMLTGGQVYRGLAGAFIVRDEIDTGLAGNSLGLPTGAHEVPLIIRDASFDSSGNFQFSNKSSGFFGNMPLVNGTPNPYLSVDKAVYRFRVLNGCNARIWRLALSPTAPLIVIGNDGGLLDKSYSLSEISLGPGERLDLLVDFRSLAADGKVMLRCLDAGWDLLQFVGTGVSVLGDSLPTSLPSIAALTAPAVTRRFTFDGMTRVNGKTYDINAVEFTVPLGQVERWVFVTNGNGPHPVHVHGASFQVQNRTGGRGRVFDWERGWKDTVVVNDKETVEVFIQFVAHRGLYVIHCHQLGHEDGGMMANFEVV
jgi:FtsP/CotA-like multicopper oxidase with cupredoxin domain